MAVQFRLRLVGGWAGFPSGSGFYALALSVVLACAAWMKPANKDFDPGERDLRGILVLHLAWSSALWILAWAESSQLPYYPRKNIYFLALSLPVIFGFLWPRGPWARWLSVATLAIFFAGIPSMTDQSFGELLARAVRPRSHFDSGEESCVRSARRWLEAEPAGLCRVSAAFPHSRTVRSGESADGGLKIRSFALNGLLAAGRIDPDVGVRLSALGDRAAANPHAEGETDEDYLARAKPADLPSVECWFYRDSLYGPSGQRLYSCRR
jgi:hypothetical protein